MIIYAPNNMASNPSKLLNLRKWKTLKNALKVEKDQEKKMKGF